MGCSNLSCQWSYCKISWCSVTTCLYLRHWRGWRNPLASNHSRTSQDLPYVRTHQWKQLRFRDSFGQVSSWQGLALGARLFAYGWNGKAIGWSSRMYRSWQVAARPSFEDLVSSRLALDSPGPLIWIHSRYKRRPWSCQYSWNLVVVLRPLHHRFHSFQERLAQSTICQLQWTSHRD